MNAENIKLELELFETAAITYTRILDRFYQDKHVHMRDETAQGVARAVSTANVLRVQLTAALAQLEKTL